MPTKFSFVGDTRAKFSQWRRYWVVISLLAAVCSTLAKETGIVTFAVCLLSDSDVLRLLHLHRSLSVLFLPSFFTIYMYFYRRSIFICLFSAKYIVAIIFYSIP